MAAGLDDRVSERRYLPKVGFAGFIVDSKADRRRGIALQLQGHLPVTDCRKQLHRGHAAGLIRSPQQRVPAGALPGAGWRARLSRAPSGGPKKMHAGAEDSDPPHCFVRPRQRSPLHPRADKPCRSVPHEILIFNDVPEEAECRPDSRHIVFPKSGAQAGYRGIPILVPNDQLRDERGRIPWAPTSPRTIPNRRVLPALPVR